jgi:predicted dienelactone hydrolase
MPYTLRLLSLVVPLLALPLSASAFEAGTTWITINPPHRGVPERVLITYPAKADGDPYTLGADALWTGVPARRNATPVAEKFPLVILSHGSGGNASALGWLSTQLAENGFIVAAPNHIHSTSGDSIPIESFKIWDRPKDVSALIDAILADPQWSKLVDPGRIGGIGFSLGGTTLMLSAGARGSLADYQAYCATMSAPESDCAWFRRGGVDFSKVDRETFDGSYKDPRLSALVAVDPGLAPAYQADSVKAIGIPTLIVNLGEGDQIPKAVRADELVKQIPGAEYAAIPGAVHLSFLAVCNPDGREVLKAYGEEDPLCDDGGDIPREILHRQMFFKIAVFLRKTLVER